MEAVFRHWTDGPRLVLAGVDGSPTSLRAGAYAAGVARRHRSRLVVAFVNSLTSPLTAMLPGSGEIPHQLSELDVSDLRRLVLAGAAHAGVAAQFVSLRGDPFTQLCHLADTLPADAVVVGNSTRARYRLPGALPVRLVRAGRWPITVVP